MTQLPDAIRERIKGKQLQIELHEIVMRSIRCGGRNLLGPFQHSGQCAI
jgi:hypothetical protein